MTKNLGVAISGGALALALAWAASPALAWGSTHPAGVAQAKLLKPDPPPVIRDSSARPGRPGHMNIKALADSPAVTDSAARLDHGPVIPPDPW